MYEMILIRVDRVVAKASMGAIHMIMRKSSTLLLCITPLVGSSIRGISLTSMKLTRCWEEQILNSANCGKMGFSSPH